VAATPWPDTADEEAEALGAFVQVHQQVPGLLGNPRAGRMPGGAQHGVPLENSVSSGGLVSRCGITNDVGTISRFCCRRSTAYSGFCSICWRCWSGLTCPGTSSCSCCAMRTRYCAVRPEAGRGGITPTGAGLTALSRLVSRCRWVEIFPVNPGTILRGHRSLVARKWTFTERRRPGTTVHRCIAQDADPSDGAGEPDLGP
jgi:hypothetical protein